jgi:hypothetical protein
VGRGEICGPGGPRPEYWSRGTAIGAVDRAGVGGDAPEPLADGRREEPNWGVVDTPVIAEHEKGRRGRRCERTTLALPGDVQRHPGRVDLRDGCCRSLEQPQVAGVDRRQTTSANRDGDRVEDSSDVVARQHHGQHCRRTFGAGAGRPGPVTLALGPDGDR